MPHEQQSPVRPAAEQHLDHVPAAARRHVREIERRRAAQHRPGSAEPHRVHDGLLPSLEQRRAHHPAIGAEQRQTVQAWVGGHNAAIADRPGAIQRTELAGPLAFAAKRVEKRAPGIEDPNRPRLRVGYDQAAIRSSPDRGDPPEKQLLRSAQLADRERRRLGELGVHGVPGRTRDDPDPGGVRDGCAGPGRHPRITAGREEEQEPGAAPSARVDHRQEVSQRPATSHLALLAAKRTVFAPPPEAVRRT